MRYSELTTDLERDLAARYQSGDREAGAALLDAHWPILVHLMQRLLGRGVDDSDVMQTACTEFLDGVAKWDLSPAVRLTSWASQRAYYKTKTAVWESTTIRVSEYALTQRMRCRKLGEDLPDSLATTLALRSTAPLSEPANDASEDATAVADVTPSDEPGPESRLGDEEAQSRRCAMVIAAMSVLDARECDILRRRFMGEERESFDSIGQAMGVSGTRVGQLCKRAATRAREAVRAMMSADDAILWGGEWRQPERRTAEAA